MFSPLLSPRPFSLSPRPFSLSPHDQICDNLTLTPNPNLLSPRSDLRAQPGSPLHEGSKTGGSPGSQYRISECIKYGGVRPP
jgi:hypothetical protein